MRKKRGYALAFDALAARHLSIRWYDLPKGAHGAKRSRVLAAAAKIDFAQAGSRPMTIKLTATGKRLLAHANRLRLTAVGTFQPPDGKPITAASSVTLRG